MPVRRGLQKVPPSAASALEERLVQELGSPGEQGQPLVIEEPPEPAPVSRLVVIWDDWTELGQQDRSEIILRAYERVRGQQATLRITVAMGLTSAEAERMGIAI
jgi:hypothetical protein